MITSHPLRERIISEMHLRRLPPLVAPVTLLQAVFLVPPDDREADREAMLAMPGVPASAQQNHLRHAEGVATNGCHFLWERHSEACTATVVIPDSGDDEEMQTRERAAMEWLEGSRGLALRAVRIQIVKDEREAVAALASMEFAENELVSCRIGETRIWSDFRIHAQGMGRLLVAAGGTQPSDLGRLIQRFQELGNYRNLALLGLPVAQQQAPELSELETCLASIASRLTQSGSDQALLDELCELAARVAAINASTSFRMSATEAYARIVDERLASLQCAPIPGFQSIDHFTERRLLPAVRTCASFVARLERLAVRIERATSLLRTRVDMTVQTQNTSLLASMDRNAERQLRLQHLVEGLSVIAISYYAFNLLDHLLGGFAPKIGLDEEQLSALLVIPVFCLVWLYLRRRAHRATQVE